MTLVKSWPQFGAQAAHPLPAVVSEANVPRSSPKISVGLPVLGLVTLTGRISQAVAEKHSTLIVF